MSKRLVALILAADEGAAFKSQTPKALHPILGKTLLRLAVDAVRPLKPARLAVIAGRGLDEAACVLGVEVISAGAPGTSSSALSAAAGIIRDEASADLLVLPADLPLLSSTALRELLTFHRRRRASLTVMSASVSDPRGRERVIRGQPGRVRIVAEGEAGGMALAVDEVYVPVFAARAADLVAVLPGIIREKSGKDAGFSVAALLARAGKPVEAFMTPSPAEVHRVLDRADLARAAGALRDRKNLGLAREGVTVTDPSASWIDLDVVIGPDSNIAPFTVIEGSSVIGRGSRVGPGCHLRNAVLGERVIVSASTVIEDAVLEDDVTIGPFARLRPKTILRRGAHVGNFVEMKAADFGAGSKAGHLSYLGDSEVGEGVNIGAGTITCNYDGERKNRTVIEAGAFIGSGSELVAPVRIGRGAYVAAGSVIVEDVAPEALAIARGRQVVKPDWVRLRRERRDGGDRK